MLHNTVDATIVKGKEKINVIPGTIILRLEGCLLPGSTSGDMMAEPGSIIGDDTKLG